jgi:hypothetical protein
MRKVLHCLIFFSVLCITTKSDAQSPVTLDGLLLTMGNYVAITDNPAPIPDYSSESDNEEHQCKPGGIVVGALLLSGGFATGITGQILGKRTYNKYLKSAFTRNTDKLHKNVMKYNTMRLFGGIAAGTGFFILVFSF